MEGADQSGQASTSSGDPRIVLALRKMIKAIEVMAIQVDPQAIWPCQEDLIRKVVKEELQSALALLSTSGNRNLEHEFTMPRGPRQRNLQLKFLGEVSAPVLTGKAIEGKGDTPLRVALVDEITGEVVASGPESKAEVEILVHESSGGGDDCNRGFGDIETRITREGDKKKRKSKPHIAKGKYICLENGVGILNCRMGHGSVWTKGCSCRLGAKIVENLGGIKVQEALTESFMVMDSRSKLYEKHYPPSLSDEIWRLVNIHKDGPLCKRLNKGDIFTVKSFLFLQSVDPQRLQKIAANPKRKLNIASCAKWKATVAHAHTCKIDDNRMYLYPSSEFEMRIAFDAVGGLKGVIHDSHFFPVNSLSESEKASAHELLLSAFENQKDLTHCADETSLLNQFPRRWRNAIAGIPNSYDDSVSESVDQDNPMQPGASYQSMNQSIYHVDSLGSKTMKQPCYPHLEDPHELPSCSSEPHSLSEFGDITNLSWEQILKFCEPIGALHFLQQSNASALPFVEATKVMLWVIRTRKKCMDLGNFQIQKKRKIG